MSYLSARNLRIRDDIKSIHSIHKKKLRIIYKMLAVHENEMTEFKKVSIRYDDSTRTYYCFYRNKENPSLEVILSYELNQGKWIVDTMEYKYIFENKFNELFNEKNIPFEEQIRYVINYLDLHFGKFK